MLQLEVQPTAPVCSGYKPATGCSTDQTAASERIAPGYATDAFLGQHFLPIAGPFTAEERPVIKHRKRVERTFFKSLDHLYTLYGWDKPPRPASPYPFNVAEAYEQAVQQLKLKHPKRRLVIVQDDEHTTTSLATADVFDPDYGYWHISIRPYHRFLRRQPTRIRTRLLSCLIRYLVYEAGVPFGRSGNDFLADQVDYLIDDIDSQGLEPDDVREYKREAAKQLAGEDFCDKRLRTTDLADLPQLIKRFKPKTEIDRQLLSAAHYCQKLIDTHPNRCLADGYMVEVGLSEEDADNYNPEALIRLENWLTFIWTEHYEDGIYSQVQMYLNSDFEQGYPMDVPCNVQVFDKSQATVTHSLDYENKLFDLINELSNYLYVIDQSL